MKKLLCMILALTMVLTLGVPAFAESYTEKDLPVVRDKVDSTETATVRFYEDLPNVPYMSVTDFYNRFYLAGTDMTEGMSFKRDGGVYTVTNFLGDKAVFDVDTDTVVIYDMKRFIEPAHDLLLTESGGYDPDYPFAKTRHVTEPEEVTPKTIELAGYDVTTSICAATRPVFTPRCPPWPTSSPAPADTGSSMWARKFTSRIIWD